MSIWYIDSSRWLKQRFSQNRISRYIFNWYIESNTIEKKTVKKITSFFYIDSFNNFLFQYTIYSFSYHCLSQNSWSWYWWLNFQISWGLPCIDECTLFYSSLSKYLQLILPLQNTSPSPPFSPSFDIEQIIFFQIFIKKWIHGFTCCLLEFW